MTLRGKLGRWGRAPLSLAVIDSQVPQKQPLGFRNTEINQYLRRLESCRSFTMSPLKPGPKAWFDHGFGMSLEEFEERKTGYLEHHPENEASVLYLDDADAYACRLAYSFFLAETYVLLPYLERRRIPFVFVLYPGGGFGLDNKHSDAMLAEILGSKYFRAVIVTQEITRRYLLDNELCDPGRVHYVYGGFPQFFKSDVLEKSYFPTDKRTLDVCFVAAKYSNSGVDKGYDLFIETAKILAKATEGVMFHVVGGFDRQDADVTGIEGRVSFHGYRQPGWLAEFYSRMDIVLSPNRPFKIYDGNFDGFPLGLDAGYCGAALFVADELQMNEHYRPDEEVVILELRPEQIAESILDGYENPDRLYELAKKGQTVTQELFDIDHQIRERLKVFGRFTTLEPSQAARSAPPGSSA